MKVRCLTTHVWVGLCFLVVCSRAAPALSQTLSHRGFVEGGAFVFPQTTTTDRAQLVGDVFARLEVFTNPASWLRVQSGVEMRLDSHDQVEESWALRYRDRTDRRPHLTIRTLSATFTRGPVTLEAGKQFVRWGKTDVVVPTDRFSPRDYLTVIDAPFLAVTAVRGTGQFGNFSIEAVWAPRLTPSRTPLINQRWAGRAGETAGLVPLIERPAQMPEGSLTGVRFGHVASRLEYSASVYDGFNHLPDFRVNTSTPSGSVEFDRIFPQIRAYGADVAMPLPWVTIKGESAYITSSSEASDEYVLYVLQVERQYGEWALVGGYAGEVVTTRRAQLGFAPDRGLSRSIVGRATYTLDANRRVDFEAAVRQNGDGLYAKAEYSHLRGQHWRTSIAGVALAGATHDFIGQYDRNSHLRVTVRYSF